MFEILPRDWNLKLIFTQKWASVDTNWGFNAPTPPPIFTLPVICFLAKNVDSPRQVPRVRFNIALSTLQVISGMIFLQVSWPKQQCQSTEGGGLSLTSSVQFNLFNSSQRKSSVKGQREKMSLEPCLKLTATDGRGAKVKWQWVPDNWSCGAF